MRSSRSWRLVVEAFPLLILCIGCGPASTASPTAKPATTASTAAAVASVEPDVPVAQPEPIAEPVDSPSAVIEPVAPQPVFRPDDPREPQDDAQLAELGIRVYESRRLKLYTDIDSDAARTLPGYVDQLYDALEAYFGPLPPDRNGTDFQMTGYLLKDERLFREAGLIPLDLPPINHGRHRANEFWMREQLYDYYRRHLLFHEVTHCFMTFVPDTQTPVWYLEGMAEHFGTHRIQADGRLSFGVMPTSPDEAAGWGRVTLIREAFADGHPRTLADVFALQPADFLMNDAYGWSWSACHFLATHPRYRERFEQLGRDGRGPRFIRRLTELFEPDGRDLATEWALYVVNLQYGYDCGRAAIDFQRGSTLTAETPARTVMIEPTRGWQSTQVLLEQGQEYTITATGEITLADEPKPWVSGPRGISIRYAEGHPLGQLLACLRAEEATAAETMLRILPIGEGRTFAAPITGTLYLRINDSWSELADNRGEFSVTITRAD
uniref:DUF1570 domain-containing protein n=1 Tax=Schlesneria paludicola TaxID=360056 RepID=A0A7C2JZB5_9PLAN